MRSPILLDNLNLIYIFLLDVQEKFCKQRILRFFIAVFLQLYDIERYACIL